MEKSEGGEEDQDDKVARGRSGGDRGGKRGGTRSIVSTDRASVNHQSYTLNHVP